MKRAALGDDNAPPPRNPTHAHTHRFPQGADPLPVLPPMDLGPSDTIDNARGRQPSTRYLGGAPYDQTVFFRNEALSGLRFFRAVVRRDSGGA